MRLKLLNEINILVAEDDDMARAAIFDKYRK
ncbi:Uncharacterised protein [Campylobacter hyointestinalis]|nr:Uncharacterised protein [Campylobacter hyointestinalis]SUW90020.1 Uncharacterised protein [Campylobacter hyointestinalis]